MMTGNGGGGVKANLNETVERLRRENELLRQDLEEARRLADFSKKGVEENYQKEIKFLNGRIAGLEYAVRSAHIIVRGEMEW